MIELDSLECDFSDADDILGESQEAPLGPLACLIHQGEICLREM